MKPRIEKGNSSISNHPPSRENLASKSKKPKNPDNKKQIVRKLSNYLIKRYSQAIDDNKVDFHIDVVPGRCDHSGSSD